MRTEMVVSSHLVEVTASAATSKSELPLPSSSGLPVFSSRIQSRLPGPRSRAAGKTVPGSHQTGKPHQLVNGLMLTGVAAASASSKVGPSRFH